MSDKTRDVEQRENEPGSRAELRDLVEEFRTALLVTHDEHGMPRARPMAIVGCDDDATLWFATAEHSPKVAEMARDRSVAVVCHRDRDDAWVSISGKATMMRDPHKVSELWTAGMSAWFSGPDDPALLLVRVEPIHAEYYEPKGFVARAFQIAKGLVADAPPKTGSVKHVDLERLSEPGRLSH